MIKLRNAEYYYNIRHYYLGKKLHCETEKFWNPMLGLCKVVTRVV